MSDRHDDKIVEGYVSFLTSLINEKGMHPHGWARRVADDQLEVFMLAIGPDDSARYFWEVVGMASSSEQRKDVLWGFDMTTLPGQGTEFADAYVFAHWTRGARGKKLACREAWRVGVINYQHDPRIVRPVDWDNEYWTKWVLGFLAKHHPPVLMHFMDEEESALAKDMPL